MKNWFKTNTDSPRQDKSKWKPDISWLKLDKWVKRLDTYIIKKFLGTYFFAIALIISIAVVFDVNENIDRFINNKAPLKAIVFDYYMNFIPYFSNLFSPLFVFIAVIFFTSKLAENSEIIAMFSTGMSFKRMMRPYMISAAIISVVTFGLGAYVIPKGNVTRLNFEDRYKKKKKQDYVRNVQLEVDSGVIAYIERYEDYNKTGYRFSLDKFDDKKLVAHLTARSITYDTASVHKWTVKNYMIREMEGMREKITRGDRLDTIIKMEPQDFLIMKGQQQTMTSPELMRELGAYLLGRHNYLRVDVKNPQFKVIVEIRDYGAYIHGPKIQGEGGLPVGTSGRALNMLSGGIDSPVAAYRMAKRGLGLDHIHFASPPYTSERAKLKVKALAQLITPYTGSTNLFVVPYTKPQEYIRDNAPDVLFTVLMRRSMMRIANIIARKQGCEALVTGESLAQVASQTVKALQCTDAAQDLPILRPLIGMDKTEIVETARHINTFETSILPYEDCCTIFTPPHPKIRPELSEILEAEAGMPGLAELEAEAAEATERIRLRITDDVEFEG